MIITINRNLSTRLLPNGENKIEAYNEETHLTSNIREKIFHKPNSNYQEVRPNRNKNKSKLKNTLTFKEQNDSSKAQQKKHGRKGFFPD